MWWHKWPTLDAYIFSGLVFYHRAHAHGSHAKGPYSELFSPGVGIRALSLSPGVGTLSHGVGDHFSFSSGVDDMALLMALMFS
jgi:hypothetical protein